MVAIICYRKSIFSSPSKIQVVFGLQRSGTAKIPREQVGVPTCMNSEMGGHVLSSV